MRESTTAEHLVLEALIVLQRGLPPGDLNDRQVIAELWGIFEAPAAREVIRKAMADAFGLEKPANDIE